MNLAQLKFLVDVGVGRQVERYLQTQGYDTKTVRAIDCRMSDQDIILWVPRAGVGTQWGVATAEAPKLQGLS
jgi:hypothetical protein